MLTFFLAHPVYLPVASALYMTKDYENWLLTDFHHFSVIITIMKVETAYFLAILYTVCRIAASGHRPSDQANLLWL